MSISTALHRNFTLGTQTMAKYEYLMFRFTLYPRVNVTLVTWTWSKNELDRVFLNEIFRPHSARNLYKVVD